MKKLLPAALVGVIAVCVLALALFMNFDKPEAPETSAPTTSQTTKPSDTTQSTAPTTPSAPEIQVITIAEALALCGEEGNVTTERYYIRGIIDTIKSAQYGQMVISDETGSIEVYGTFSSDGSTPYGEMTEKPYKGDEVLLHCILQNYKGTKEVKNARLIEFKHNEPTVDEKEYTAMSVAQAREAAAGTKIKLTGVVAMITYADGLKPTGLYLVDGTNSILIHDGDLAQRVQIGNKITVAGSKAYWVLASEQTNADKFGYKGSCQLEDATLLENDNSTGNKPDLSWVSDSTVKDLIDTPVSENITTTIFKVNALVKKVDGKGFVNYYFFDLDGETGSYAYSQASGADFAWLDEFDGKICTVYLSAINAKSTATDCFFRLQPIQVIDEGFKFDGKEAAQHVVKYDGIPQFGAKYTGDPALELVTSVSSQLLGFENAALSYASSDTKVIVFKEENGKTVMHCVSSGTATVTVTGSYDGAVYSQDVTITVETAQVSDSMTVQDAINAADGETVTVQGIVGPSLVNQSGFYLIDDTGVIAVTLDSAQFEGLAIGHEVVLTGIRDTRNPKNGNCHGQTQIKEATIVTNLYGKHEYATSHFITGKTLADFYTLNAQEDHSTSVFVLKATVELVETNYYTSIKLVSGDTSVNLYCSSASQYNFLKAYAGQEITIELAACNWNSKSYYTGCVLAVLTEDGKVVNELNFLK